MVPCTMVALRPWMPNRMFSPPDGLWVYFKKGGFANPPLRYYHHHEYIHHRIDLWMRTVAARHAVPLQPILFSTRRLYPTGLFPTTKSQLASPMPIELTWRMSNLAPLAMKLVASSRKPSVMWQSGDVVRRPQQTGQRSLM